MSGVEVLPLKVFLDDRGWLFEMARLNEHGISAKQITVSHIFPGAVKAFHKHEKQTDWVTCAHGDVKLITFRLEKDPKTGKETPTDMRTTCFGEKNPVLVKIPTGHYHGYTPLGQRPATIIYITDQTYDANDEFRLQWDYLGKETWNIQNK